MTTKTTPKKPSRLMAEIMETASDLHRLGLMDRTTHEKITKRQISQVETATVAPLTGKDIRRLREQAQMSQAVFALHLQLTPGYLSQLERGVRQASGPALVLLHTIRRHGIKHILS